MNPINVQCSEMVVAYEFSAMRDAVSLADVATGPLRSTSQASNDDNWPQASKEDHSLRYEVQRTKTIDHWIKISPVIDQMQGTLRRNDVTFWTALSSPNRVKRDHRTRGEQKSWTGSFISRVPNAVPRHDVVSAFLFTPRGTSVGTEVGPHYITVVEDQAFRFHYE